VAITLLGQAAFLGSYIDGNAKAAHNDCLTQTTQIIHTFETQHQVVLTDDEAMSYKNKVCDT
ncbi:MAG: hypothetical protein ABIR91_02750, partial [Candidatus Saccharimonadales bacterium]